MDTPRQLLLVEDDAAFARRLARSFERRGYQVIQAASAVRTSVPATLTITTRAGRGNPAHNRSASSAQLSSPCAARPRAWNSPCSQLTHLIRLLPTSASNITVPASD